MTLPEPWRMLGGIALQVLEEADGDAVAQLVVSVDLELDQDALRAGWADLIEGTVLEDAQIGFVDGDGAPRLLAWCREPGIIRIPDLHRTSSD